MLSTEIVIGLTAVVVAVTEQTPRVLVVRRMRHGLATPAQQGANAVLDDSPEALPYGPFDPDRHRTLELGLRGWVEEQTGLRLSYVEQLYTFANQYRDPRELFGGARVLSIAYLVLARETPVSGSGQAQWRDWYGYFPWEDWRGGRPSVVDEIIRPGLERWIAAAPPGPARTARRERVAMSFSMDGAAPFDGVRSLDRYELLYEAELVSEAWRDRRIGGARRACAPPPDGPRARAGAQTLGAPMAVDNRRVLASALGRLRGKLGYRPVIFDLLPREFTLLRMQRVVEALSGRLLHKQNFRRMVRGADLVEPTGRRAATGPGRPAALYRFRREALTERVAVGVGLPTLRIAD